MLVISLITLFFAVVTILLIAIPLYVDVKSALDDFDGEIKSLGSGACCSKTNAGTAYNLAFLIIKCKKKVEGNINDYCIL